MESALKSIPGYDGEYGITPTGQVYSYKSNRFLKGRTIHKFGYPMITLCKAGKPKTHTVHRLVALVFIPNPLNLPEVAHVDNNPKNPNANNLKWSTKSDNEKDKEIHGTKLQGSKHFRSKLTENDIRYIRGEYLSGNTTQASLAKRYAVGQDEVSRIVNYRIWRHVS